MDHDSITSITPAISPSGSWCCKKVSLGRGGVNYRILAVIDSIPRGIWFPVGWKHAVACSQLAGNHLPHGIAPARVKRGAGCRACVCACTRPALFFKSASAGLAPRQTRGPPLAKTLAKEYERGRN